MAITRAVGFPINNATSATSVSATWKTVGDLAVLSIGNFSDSTNTISSVSSSHATGWVKVTSGADATDGWTHNIWMGNITGAVADTITVTWSSAPASFEVVVDELNSGLGSSNVWAVVANNTLLDTTGAYKFPQLTSNTVTLQAYWGYQIFANSGSGGSTSGFTYTVTSTSNIITFNGGLSTSTAYQPTSNGTGTNAFAGAGIISAALSAAAFVAAPAMIIGQGGTPTEMTGIARPPSVKQAVRRGGYY